VVKAEKLGHLVLAVRDCVRSRDFYTRHLGLKISSEKLERGQVFLTLGDEHHVLALFQRATAEPPTPEQPGIVHIAFSLNDADDLQAARKELNEAGIPIEADDTRALYIRDPDNNRVMLFCGRSENAAAEMTTAARH